MSIQIRDAPRFPIEDAIPLATGLVWLSIGSGAGVDGFLLCAVPGVLLISGAVGLYLTNGDARTHQVVALGAACGVGFGVLALPAVGVTAALGLVALSAASFCACGWTAQRASVRHEKVPDPPLDLELACKVALDHLALSGVVITRAGSLGTGLERIAREVSEAVELFEARGWTERPESYLAEPLPFTTVGGTPARAAGGRYVHLRTPSEFDPDPQQPGRERWLALADNRTAHAWMLRGDPARPWIVCVHGLGMGMPWLDLRAFAAFELAERRGLNVLMPVLPLHGPRARGWRSGLGFVEGDMLDTFHALSQSCWDLRRWIGWLRAEGARRIGVYGLSLGSYNAALLAGLDAGLHTVIAGIPASSVVPVVRRMAPPRALIELEALGVPWPRVETLFSVVCPLSLAPALERDALYLFAASADHVVPPDQARDLWRHWGEPRIAWYAGSHLSFPREPEVRALLGDALSRLAGSPSDA